MRLLDYDGLLEKGINYSRVHLWRLVVAERFPRPVKGAGKGNAWLESEIDEFIAGLVADRDDCRGGPA